MVELLESEMGPCFNLWQSHMRIDCPAALDLETSHVNRRYGRSIRRRYLMMWHFYPKGALRILMIYSNILRIETM